MSSETGTKTIIVAAGANIGIAVAKFIAGSMSGSAAMLSEAVHSVVDTGNEILLFVGVKMSRRPPDDLHPFGHGRDLYFFTVLVAMLIFAAGGGAAIYEGAGKLMHPTPLTSPLANYIVLGIAMVLEGISFTVAAAEFEKHRRPDVRRWRAFKMSKDPSIFAVMYEDSAALAGLSVAFIGTSLDAAFNAPVFDAAASLTIGGILIVVACLLVADARGLLIGERADRHSIAKIREIVSRASEVNETVAVLTMQQAPHEVLLILTLRFRLGLPSSDLARALDLIEKQIRDELPDVSRVFIDVEGLTARGQPAAVSAPS